MMQRLWRARVLAREFQQRLLAVLYPTHLRYITYSWPLRSNVCPCDVHFCEYIEERKIRGRSVFHLGTGGHHLVGARNHDAKWGNEILGLTISPAEHTRYVRRLIRDPSFGSHYKVLFCDLHTLCAAALPKFDVVSLFHLCELKDLAGAGRRANADGVLRTFCSCLSPGGSLLLYRGSSGFALVEPIIIRAIADGLLRFVEDYKTLAVYQAPEGD